MKHGPKSRKKVINMGMGLVIVAGYWLIVGFTISHLVLEVPRPVAALVAVICSGLVFGIDRSIILVTGTAPVLVVARLTLALFIAVLGGVGLDLVLLRGEVEQELVTMNHVAADDSKQQVQAAYAEAIAEAKRTAEGCVVAYAKAEQSFVDEINGSYSGSGRYGVGKVALEKKGLVELRERELAAARAAVARLETEESSAMVSVVDALARAQATPTLFARVHALHRYIGRDRAVLIGWIILTLILIGVELIPVLVKYASGQSSYELEVETVDAMQRQRTMAVALIQHNLYASRKRMGEVEREALASLVKVTSVYGR